MNSTKISGNSGQNPFRIDSSQEIEPENPNSGLLCSILVMWSSSYGSYKPYDRTLIYDYVAEQYTSLRVSIFIKVSFINVIELLRRLFSSILVSNKIFIVVILS